MSSQCGRRGILTPAQEGGRGIRARVPLGTSEEDCRNCPLGLCSAVTRTVTVWSTPCPGTMACRCWQDEGQRGGKGLHPWSSRPLRWRQPGCLRSLPAPAWGPGRPVSGPDLCRTRPWLERSFSRCVPASGVTGRGAPLPSGKGPAGVFIWKETAAGNRSQTAWHQ